MLFLTVRTSESKTSVSHFEVVSSRRKRETRIFVRVTGRDVIVSRMNLHQKRSTTRLHHGHINAITELQM